MNFWKSMNEVLKKKLTLISLTSKLAKKLQLKKSVYSTTKKLTSGQGNNKVSYKCTSSCRNTNQWFKCEKKVNYFLKINNFKKAQQLSSNTLLHKTNWSSACNFNNIKIMKQKKCIWWIIY